MRTIVLCALLALCGCGAGLETCKRSEVDYCSHDGQRQCRPNTDESDYFWFPAGSSCSRIREEAVEEKLDKGIAGTIWSGVKALFGVKEDEADPAMAGAYVRPKAKKCIEVGHDFPGGNGWLYGPWPVPGFPGCEKYLVQKTCKRCGSSITVGQEYRGDCPPGC